MPTPQIQEIVQQTKPALLSRYRLRILVLPREVSRLLPVSADGAFSRATWRPARRSQVQRFAVNPFATDLVHDLLRH